MRIEIVERGFMKVTPDDANRDVYLEEGNSWNDVFWGVCRGKGRNELGKLLMKIRSELAS